MKIVDALATNNEFMPQFPVNATARERLVRHLRRTNNKLRRKNWEPIDEKTRSSLKIELAGNEAIAELNSHQTRHYISPEDMPTTIGYQVALARMRNEMIKAELNGSTDSGPARTNSQRINSTSEDPWVKEHVAFGLSTMDLGDSF